MNQRVLRSLTTFIKADSLSEMNLICQTTLRVAILITTFAIAWTEGLARQPAQAH
jgi:hypothetical protein